MHPKRLALLALNVIGGIAVLGSYAHGIATHETAGADLWGGVPASLQPFYNVNMLLAAAGYFLFGPYVLFRLDPDRTRVLGRFGFGAFFTLFALILVPSALWMPITFAWRASPSEALWLLDRLVLALTGLGSIGLLAAVVTADPVPSRLGRGLAIAGAVAFTVQTALLDALVWPAYYRG